MAVLDKAKPSEWLDREAYPFAPNWFAAEGGRMHYVDEGEGSPVVFVHGTPTWSFMYRRLISGLSLKHRCIAPDHVGFGLSEKPQSWGYSPEQHARNLGRLIDSLDLRDITLVVHDFGGPIGLSYALENPSRIRGLVVMNSWMWSLREFGPAKNLDRAIRSPLGKAMYAMNYPVSSLMPKAFVDKFKLPDRVHEQYKKPFSKFSERNGPYGMAKGLVGSSSFFQGLWGQKEKLADKPALILWGMKDKYFTPDFLTRWQSVFPSAKVEKLAGSGHFVCEECANEVEAAIYLFMDGQRELDTHHAAINVIE